MPPTVILASDVMDSSAALLNDAPRELYTNEVQLPYLQMANEQLSDVLESNGVSIPRKSSTAIVVSPQSTTLPLPNDFLLPIKLWERGSGETDSDWIGMSERGELVGHVATNNISFWSFNNNQVNLVPCTQTREVLMGYERSLGTLLSENSPIDVNKFRRYLSRKTAELCARFIGMNSTLADEILSREVIPAENDLSMILVKNMQGVRHRRGSATNRWMIIR